MNKNYLIKILSSPIVKVSEAKNYSKQIASLERLSILLQK